MNRKKKAYDQQFWALVADEQIELMTKRENARSKAKPKQNTKHTYKLDTYQGIEYSTPLNNKFSTNQEVTDTTKFKVTKIKSQITKKQRSML